MKISLIASFAAVVVIVICACSPPQVNAERTAACKDSGNSKMCDSCCKTKVAKYTAEGMAGSCVCSGELEK